MSHPPLEQRKTSREPLHPERLLLPESKDIPDLIAQINLALQKFIVRIPWAEGSTIVLPDTVGFEASTISTDDRTWDFYLRLKVHPSILPQLEGTRVKLVHLLSPEIPAKETLLDNFGSGIIKGVQGFQTGKRAENASSLPSQDDPREPYLIDFEPPPPLPLKKEPVGLAAV